ncbi:uncharacterized protein DFL_005376 [Arthrobotrys flagrans]|uniref:Tetratricopeptide repeat protein n=1 Tax=Arthrobotrys flagrans TaxID=97331 RepID=A0A437A7G8_ARTFL|nr:hypothetical protein DFL_005376 [Arthrobotrys flagrans]
MDIDALSNDEENAIKLIKNLYWLFHEEVGNRAYLQFLYNNDDLWVDVWAAWVQFNAYSLVVRDILKIAGKYKEAFDPEELAWISQAASSAKTLFQPWKNSRAKFWLERRGHESSEIKEFSYRWGNMGSLTPEKIRSLASYAPEPVRDTVYWHSIMAWTLAIAKRSADAIPVFRKVVEISSSAWLAYERLARAYTDLKMYKEAIPVREEACRAVTDIWAISEQLYADIAQWKWRLGDNVGASEAAKGCLLEFIL